MKKIIYVGLALLFVSCGKVVSVGVIPSERETTAEAETTGPGKHGGDVFHACFDTDSEDTKTMLSEDMEFLWNENDEISLFNATTYNREYLFDGMDESESGDFYEINSPESRGVVFSEKALDRIYAVSPYMTSKHIAISNSGVITIDLPDTQTYREKSVGPGANIMTSVTADAETRNLVFKNACGFLKINLYGDDVVLNSVTITSNGVEKLSGRAKIPLIYGQPPVIEMQSTKTNSYVTLTSSEGVELGKTAETATAFWFVIPPTTFSSGFTLSATGFYGGTFSKSAPLNFTVERNKYYNIAPLKVTLTGGSMGAGIVSWDSASSYSGTTE